jgi:hypothetical protein
MCVKTAGVEKYLKITSEYMPPPKNKFSVECLFAEMSRMLWWKCSNYECKHEWQATGDSRVQNDACPVCSGNMKQQNNI